MIELLIDGEVAEIVLDNPKKLNVLDEDALRELARTLDEAAGKGIRCLLLRGEGRGFCAGRDVSGVDPATDDVAGYLDGLLTPLMRQIMDFPAPTIAAVHGPCLGVGLGLALACDVVYVADDASFGSPFVRLGAVLDSGAHHLFAERLGSHRTLDLVYTGDLISGAEAVRAGLFSRSMPTGELLAFAREKARAIAAGPTRALMASKQLVNRQRSEAMGLFGVLDEEGRLQAEVAASADYREGFLAFQDKRRPVFTGR